jgi:hypothetical protein
MIYYYYYYYFYYSSETQILIRKLHFYRRMDAKHKLSRNHVWFFRYTTFFLGECTISECSLRHGEKT